MDNKYNIIHAVDINTGKHVLIDDRDTYINVMYGLINMKKGSRDNLTMDFNNSTLKLIHVINILNIKIKETKIKADIRMYSIKTYGTPHQSLRGHYTMTIPVKSNPMGAIKTDLLERLDFNKAIDD